jgi:hypothetical protein
MDLPTAICSQCGYDLRGIASERCPECGFELAGQVTLGGEIPWTYRKLRGRLRTFIETVNKVTIGGPWLSRVIAGPVSLADARRFWFIAATIASLPLIAVFVYVWTRFGDLIFVTYLPDPLTLDPSWRKGFGLAPATASIDWAPAWLKTDVLWPLSAGLTRPGVAIVALWLFVLFGSGAPTYLFHPRSLSEVQRSRANAFAYYLCAPLVWATVPLLASFALTVYAIEKQQVPFRTPVLFAGLAVIVWLLTIGLWYMRLLKSLHRTTHASLPHVVAAAVLVPTFWLGSAAFALVFVPWCVGVAWLLLDAMLR